MLYNPLKVPRVDKRVHQDHFNATRRGFAYPGPRLRTQTFALKSLPQHFIFIRLP